MNRLKLIRERKSLTLAQVSARTSIPLRLLTDYEANLQEIPPTHLKVLSKALWVKPEELLVPTGPAAPAPPAAPASGEPAEAAPLPSAAPPPPPAPAPVYADAPPPAIAPAAGPPAYQAPRPYTPAAPYAAPYAAPRPPRPPGPPPPTDMGRGGRGPARSRREPVVMPATDGQITEIMRLAARLNLSTEEIERQFGRGIDNITRFDAREWIKKLREDALAKAPPAKVHFGQWPGLKEDREAAYLGSLRDERAVLRVTLFNGQVFSGQIVDFTPYTITLQPDEAENGEQVVLRKLAIADYQDTGAQAAAEPVSEAPAHEVAPFNGASAPDFRPPAGAQPHEAGGAGTNGPESGA